MEDGRNATSPWGRQELPTDSLTLELKPGTFRDRYPSRDPYPFRDRHAFRDPYPLRDPHPSSVSVSAVGDGRNATSPWGLQDLRDEFLRRAAYFLLIKDRTGTPPKIQLGSLEF